MVERIYSSIATEIYKQIKEDLKEKINLFPTKHLRAVALFYEASDFARSNTIDAYDLAIELYKESLRYFNISTSKWITKYLIRYRGIWRLGFKFQHILAKVQIGYAECLIYKRGLSPLSGKYRNPLFGIRKELEEVIESLQLLHNKINNKWELPILKEQDGSRKKQDEEKKKYRLQTLMSFLTSPRESWLSHLLKPDELLYEKQRRLLFDAHVMLALAHYYLEAMNKAKDHLEFAKAVEPTLSEQDALYLFACGVIEPYPQKAILHLRKATDIAPNFQIAQYLLAYYSEMEFRQQNELSKERAKSVLKEYERVWEINPGNIAALAAQGYLWWLLKDGMKKAEAKFQQGRDVKAIVRETFTGTLNYGLARIAGEKGDFNTCYDLLNEAVSAEPGIGAYSVSPGSLVTTPFYDYIDSAMLNRFKEFKENIETWIINAKPSQDGKKIYNLEREEEQGVSNKTIDRVHSFVLNDFGNACLNYFHRFGDRKILEDAINAYKEAVHKDHDNKVAHYNLQNAYGWRGDWENALKSIEKAERIGPIWPVAVIALIQSRLQQNLNEITEKEKEYNNAVKERDDTKKELKQIEEELAGARSEVPLTKDDRAGRGATPQGPGMQQPRPQPDIKSLQLKRDKTISKIVSHDEKVDSLKKGIDDLKKDQQTKLEIAIKKIIEKTKLKSLYEGYGFEVNGKGIGELLLFRNTIEISRLDENDVGALIVWAEILSNQEHDGESSERAHEAAEDLFGYLLSEYYPNHYDINRLFQNMYLRKLRKLKIAKKMEGKKEIGIENKINDFENKMKPLIEYWSVQDPSRFTIQNLIGNLCNLLGNISYEVGEYREAEECYRKAVKEADEKAAEIDPIVWRAGTSHANLGLALKSLKRWDEAEKAFKGAISIEPNNAVYQNNLGNLYFETARFQDAIPYYEKAIELDPRPIYEYNLGGAYGNLPTPNWEEMIKHRGKAVELRRNIQADPFGLDYYYDFLAEAYFKADKLKEFEELFEKSGDFKAEPEKKAIIYNWLGNLFFNSYREKESIPYYEKATILAPSVAVYHANLGGSYRKLGKLEEVEKEYQEAIKLEPSNARYQNDLGTVYFESGDYEKAVEQYGRAIVLDRQPIYECNLGRAYGNLPMPNWAEMIKHCGKAVELRRNIPTDPYGLDYYYDFLAEGYVKASRLKEFEALFEKSGDLKEEPEKKAIIYNKIGNLLAWATQYQEAIPYYERAIELDSNRPIYECNLGLTYGNLWQWEKAIEHYARAVELRKKAPTDPYGRDYYYDFLAEAYFKADKLKEFEELFEKSGDFKAEPEKKAIIYNKTGNLLAWATHYQEAIPYYEKTIELDSNRPIYECNLGLTYGNLGQLEKAIEHYARAVELRKKSPTDPYGLDYYYEFLAEGYVKASRLKEFEALFEKSGDLKEEPEKKAIIYNKIGNLYFDAARFHEAIPHYEKAIALDHLPIYECNLGRAYGNMPMPNWDEMIKHCEKAVELRRNILSDSFGLDYYYDFLAEAYFKAGKLKEFEELFEKSGDLKEEPEKKAIIHNKIGNLLAWATHYQEAIPYYEKAIRLDSNRPIYECNLGLTYGNLGQWEKAIEHYTRAVELRKKAQTDPYGLDYYYDFLAEGYVKAGKLKEFEA